MPQTSAQEPLPRLLILTSTYPRWSGDHEPGFVHELARRLVDRFEVQVLCPHASGAATSEVLDGVAVQRFRYAPQRLETLVNDGGIVNNLRRNRWMWLLVPFFLLTQTWSTWRAIRRFNPDVIHAHWLIPQGLIVALLSLFLRRVPPFLVTSHGADLHALRFWPMPVLKRFVVRRAAAVTVVSSPMIDVMRVQGIPVDGVKVEPMGVDLTTRFTLDESVPRSENEILFVGRLVEKKGLRYLIEAMPAIIDRHPDTHLTVAGYGPEKNRLQRLAESLGLQGKIRFLGAVPQENLPDLYRRAAVFVAPFVEAAGGDQEGLGLVTVEAIGCGCPVVVSDLPAVAEVVDDEILRVAPGNASQLAEAVNRILALTKLERTALVRPHRARLHQWLDWQNRGKAYVAVLQGLVR